jgi:hypothetical protein
MLVDLSSFGASHWWKSMQANVLMRAVVCGVVGILFLVPAAPAQETPHVTISGTVVDDSTSLPLFGVNVFLVNTTLGCSTDENGGFVIRGIPLATYEITASRLGYGITSMRTRIPASGLRNLEIRLRPASVQLGEVLVAASDQREWRKNLDRFDDLFIGTTPDSKECTIMNPEVLDFASKGPDDLEATASRPLEIDNQALGYHIEFLLKTFKVLTTVMTVEGMPRYTLLKPSSADQEKEWKENRLRAYKGSLRDFLIALYHRKLEENGFSIYLIGSLAPPYLASRQPVKEDEILSDLPREHEKSLRFAHYLEVEYDQNVEPGFNLLQRGGTTKQISWLTLNYYSVTITDNGLIDEQFPTRVYGYWAWKRMADALPTDYEPEKN